MNWWCSAQGGAWTWSWQPYVGVWLLCGTCLAWYIVSLRRRRRTHGMTGERASLTQRLSFFTGIAVFWIAADWPIGALGAGYLLSVHTLQYILFVFVAPPLLIAGTPLWLRRDLVRPRAAFAIVRRLSRPLTAFAIFNVVMLGSHLPPVIDGLTVSQIGSFAVDMTWFFSGIVFWLPVLGPLPELQPLPYPGRIVYLVANIFIPTVPASFMTFAEYPIYALYELAPPVAGLTAMEDQQIAGLTMKLLGGFIIFGSATVLFFKWWNRESAVDALDRFDRPPHGPGGDDGGADLPDGPPDTSSDRRSPAVVGSA